MLFFLYLHKKVFNFHVNDAYYTHSLHLWYYIFKNQCWHKFWDHAIYICKMASQHFHICIFLLPIVEYNFYVRNHHMKVEKVHDFPLKCHKMSYCTRKNANFCIVRYKLLFAYIILLGVSLYFILDTIWCQFNMYIEDVFVHNSAILMLY